jgi:hypothetical protein
MKISIDSVRGGDRGMTSTTELLTNALVLAILAPDQERADRAIAMAEQIASRLTPKQIASAKRAAIKLAK